MPQVVVDALNNAALWGAFAPDGATPSTEIALGNDTAHVRFSSGDTSMRVTATANALNHSLRRALPNLDLTNSDDLRLWILSDRAATVSPAQPFFLQVRLASAAMGLADPANTWSRYLPVYQRNSWDLARLRLDDLPAPVRAAVNGIELRCVDASQPFTCYLEDLLAVREEMIGDVDAALLGLLDGQFAITGAPVPAVFFHPENPPPPTIPSIRITQYDLQYARERTLFNQPRGDFGPNGFRIEPVSIMYDIYYYVDVYAATRAQKTAVMEFVLHTLSPRMELLVTGAQLTLEWVTVEPLDETGKWRSDRELLYFKVATRQESGASVSAVPPYREVSIAVDQPA